MSRLPFVLTLLTMASGAPLLADDIGIPCDPGASTTPILIGDIFECSIEVPGDSDVYTFDGSAGDIVLLTLSDLGFGNVFVMVADVFDPSQQLLTTLTANNTGEMVLLTLAETGTYTVFVFEEGNDGTEDYNVALQGLSPLPPQAVELCNDCVDGETVSPVADSDVYTFAGTAGDTVVLTLSDLGFGNIFEMITDVFDPSQQLIASLTADSTGTEHQLTLASSGTYTLIAYENGNDGTETYNLALQQLFPVAPAAVPLLFGISTGNQEIDPVADSDVYTFIGTAGDSAILTLSDLGGGNVFALLADVFDPSEQLVATILANNTGESETIDLVESGVYTVRVREEGNDGTETYTLLLQCLFGTCFTNPDITVVPDRFNFGNVEVGMSSAPKNFVVSNVGDADLTITGITSGDPVFAVSNETCTGAPVGPGGNCSFDATFTPSLVVRFVSTLTIQSNDPDTPALDINVVGTGTGISMPGVVGGSVFGLDLRGVTCVNATTGERVNITDGLLDWDCGAEGLPLNLGDQIVISISGTME